MFTDRKKQEKNLLVAGLFTLYIFVSFRKNILGFYILRNSLCPAVLTENFFMDSHSDLEYLQSRTGKKAIIDTHVEAITEYLTR